LTSRFWRRRDDFTREEALAEDWPKLQALAGAISGTTPIADAEALKERLAKSVKEKNSMVARGGIEPSTLRFQTTENSELERAALYRSYSY
jgi:hypothetical protein